MVDTQKLIQRLQTQIAIAKEIDSSFISMTIGTAKKVVSALKECERKDARIEELEERVAIMIESNMR
jgi:hypothetical protein